MVFLPYMFGYMFYFGEQSGFVYTESLKLLVLLYLLAFFCAISKTGNTNFRIEIKSDWLSCFSSSQSDNSL
ncbi:unknown [Prevotella sp. CAG:924]|nr:unknown [Prevotella sp. CAG:924]